MPRIIIALLFALLVPPASADTTITYQGQLQDDGQPFDGQADMTFELFDGFDPNDPAVGNSVAGPLTIADVEVSDGLFQVELDFGAVYSQPVWLEIAVGTDTLQPRHPIAPAPLATHALNVADGVSGVWNKTGDHIHYDSGNVGIQTTTTDVPLRVKGNLIAGYSSNTVSDSFNSAIIGGSSNSISNTSQNSVIAGGGGNTMTGTDSFIAAGLNNEVSSWRSFAGGNRARAIHDSSFVWGDSTTENISSQRNDQFLIRSTGGAMFHTGTHGLYSISESSSVDGAAIQAESVHPDGIALVGRNESDDATLVLNNRGTGPIIRAFNVGSERFRLHNNGTLSVDGSLGVGTFNPQASMHVRGDFQLEFNDFRVAFNPGLSDGSEQSIVMGHVNNSANGGGNTISGGGSDGAANVIADGLTGTIGGGEGNFIGGSTTSPQAATISGGLNNEVSEWGATVSGGESNSASGWYSTIAGGAGNVAAGTFSYAAGSRARNSHDGTFLWADYSSGFPSFSSKSNNEFAARATGGVRFVTGLNSNDDPNAGVKVGSGGGFWQAISDRHAKMHIEEIDPDDVLARVVEMPVSEYSYKSQDSSIRHMGPMAQDFHPLFGLGEDELRISAMNLAGVSLASIQGLYAKLEIKRERIDRLHARFEELESQNLTLRDENEDLRKRLSALESLILEDRKVVDQ